MKIIESSRAPNPRRVRIFLAEKGIKIPSSRSTWPGCDHRRAEFCEFNPMRQVPVLVLDDGTAIAETRRDLPLFRVHPSRAEPVRPGALEKARIEMWNRRLEFGLFFPVDAGFPPSAPGDARHGGAAGLRLGRSEPAARL